jgi:OOP family OmpA-OmpF porin
MNIFYKTGSTLKAVYCLLAILLLFAAAASAQNKKMNHPLQLADRYFAAGEYYTAALLYGQYLNPAKEQQRTVSDFPLNLKERRNSFAAMQGNSRFDILFKQAESYRLAHYWKEAAAAYKECSDYDASKYADALYWYAVCERSMGHYSSAEEILKNYLNHPGDIQFTEQARKELQSIKFIQMQLARPDSVLFTTIKLQAPSGAEKGAYAPVYLGGNQFLFSSTETSFTQAVGANPHLSRLFYGSLQDGHFVSMEPLIIPGADPTANQGAATISPDGKRIYFTQWKKQDGNPGGQSSIYFSTRLSEGWSTAAELPLINLAGYNSRQPFLSSDGKYLFFSSDMPGGSGGFDIWYAPLNEDGTTATPVNAGPVINSDQDEVAPFYHSSSQTLVFSSNGRLGMGGFDLYAAKGNGYGWQMPENLGHPVNSPKDDIYFYAAENTALLANAFLSSDRGEGCCLETYHISKKPKNKTLGGFVFECERYAPLGGAEVVLKDMSGKTWATTTDAGGRYYFELGDKMYNELSLTVNKEFYFEHAAPLKIQRIDESDWLTDNLQNSALCLQKIPEEKPEEPAPLVIKAADVVTVFFDFDKSALKPEALRKLDSIYQVMMEEPAATIQISGYTDGLGSDAYNKKLSDRRAKACADYLVKKGIDKKRVSFASFGACCPVEMEKINGRDNPDGRSKNRRALINVKKD